MFVVTALVVTVVIAWATWVVDRHSNERLLNQQVRQTASVLGNQVPVITAQMLDAVQVARESHADPDRRCSSPT